MQYEFTLKNCTAFEIAFIWFHLSLLIVAAVGFIMMLLSLKKRDYDNFTFMSMGAILMFFPRGHERQGVWGRRIFFIGVTSFVLLLAVLTSYDVCT